MRKRTVLALVAFFTPPAGAILTYVSHEPGKLGTTEAKIAAALMFVPLPVILILFVSVVIFLVKRRWREALKYFGLSCLLVLSVTSGLLALLIIVGPV